MGAAGGRRGSAQHPPLPGAASQHSLQGQALQSPMGRWMDGQMDGRTDGWRSNTSRSDITFGPLLPVRPTIPWLLDRESTCHQGPG